MEIPSSKWIFDELEMEDPTFSPQHQMNPMAMDYSIDDCLNFQYFSSESYSSIAPGISSTHNMTGSYIMEGASNQLMQEDMKRPAKQFKTNDSSWEYSCVSNNKHMVPPTPSPSALSKIISFESTDLDFSMTYENELGAKMNIGSLTRSPLHAQDHVIAERKRREKISQLYIALSRLLPTLKKGDKASILGDAIKYVKQLQDRVKFLEEKVAKKTVESAICVKKTQIYAGEQSSSWDDANIYCQPSHSSLPEIEARVSDKDVLIRIHCEKNKGIFLVNLLDEIEKLNLSVVSSNVLPFGRATLDITIAAQMEDEFSMTAKDLVKSLRLALQRSK